MQLRVAFRKLANPAKNAQTCFLDIVVTPGDSCVSNYALPKEAL